MSRKHIYDAGELPDHALHEFQEIRLLFVEFINSLAEKHSPVAISAGLSRAHLDLFKMSAGNNLKKVLMNTADYYLKQAEKIKEEA